MPACGGGASRKEVSRTQRRHSMTSLEDERFSTDPLSRQRRAGAPTGRLLFGVYAASEARTRKGYQLVAECGICSIRKRARMVDVTMDNVKTIAAWLGALSTVAFVVGALRWIGKQPHLRQAPTWWWLLGVVAFILVGFAVTGALGLVAWALSLGCFVGLVIWRIVPRIRGTRQEPGQPSALETPTHSHPRLPMPGIVERAEKRAQERASGVEVKYPSGRQDAVAMPSTVHIGAKVRQKSDERKEQIRMRLAELILDGDQAWNAASTAHQVWEKNQLRGVEVPIPEWWKAVRRWLDEVEAFLVTTREFGEGEATLFRAQEPSLETPPGKAPLSIEVRTQQDMQLIRLKQDKLRRLRENL